MEPKEIRFEDMKDLNCGDLIIINDPAFQQEMPYVLMSKTEDSFYFVTTYGASLMVNCQNTIDGFNVKLIDDTHPKWDAALSDHGKQLARMLEQFEMKQPSDI